MDFDAGWPQNGHEFFECRSFEDSSLGLTESPEYSEPRTEFRGFQNVEIAKNLKFPVNFGLKMARRSCRNFDDRRGVAEILTTGGETPSNPVSGVFRRKSDRKILFSVAVSALRKFYGRFSGIVKDSVPAESRKGTSRRGPRLLGLRRGGGLLKKMAKLPVNKGNSENQAAEYTISVTCFSCTNRTLGSRNRISKQMNMPKVTPKSVLNVHNSGSLVELKAFSTNKLYFRYLRQNK